MIRLEGAERLARGELHDVYQHPGDDDLLVKIPSPERAARRWKAKRRWLLQRRYGIYTAWVREIREQIASRARFPDPPPFLQCLAGLVETDLGLGLAVAKVRDRDGRLAPTLESVVRASGFTAELRRALDDLAADLIARNVVIGDLHQRNILCGSQADGSLCLVVIDGVGDKTLIPVNTMFWFLNRRTIRRRMMLIAWRLEALDQLGRRYHRP